MKQKLDFSDEQIQALFGHEAAEDETPDVLRRYYFKSDVYESCVNSLPLRILVGHKGIGKSALFQVASAEESEAGKLTLLIKPDEISGIGQGEADFLQLVREWKSGFTEIIARKVLLRFGQLPKDGDGGGLREKITHFGGQVASTIKDILKANQLHLSSADNILVNNFLKSEEIIVYVDDLDRGWRTAQQSITRISALLSAVRDLSRENRGIKFRISLRSDVYFLVRTSDESTDKTEGSVVWHTWTNHEIFVLLVKRVENFFGRTVNEKNLLRMGQPMMASYLRPVMEERFSGRGHWINAPMYRVLMTLIRKRPRDLVKLCSMAARSARSHGKGVITTKDFENSFAEYSHERLQDTVNEFKSELPQVERLLLGMKPSKIGKTSRESHVYTTDALLKKIGNIQERGQFQFSNGNLATPKALAQFMYKVNFLTARKESPNGHIERQYFEENRYLQSEFADFGFAWEVHPAYRWALQPDSVDRILEHLELSADV